MRVPVTVAVMLPAAAQEPCTCDVYGQAKTSNRDRLAEVDRDRRKDTADGFVPDQQCDHREDNRTAESGKVAELAGAGKHLRLPWGLTGDRSGRSELPDLLAIGRAHVTCRASISAQPRSKRQLGRMFLMIIISARFWRVSRPMRTPSGSVTARAVACGP